ncbi:HNH endonuclease signature motif containing protein [Arthrobacter sp. zg-Y238]|uniref:HNH endonuclease n=1 Tax=Arthrobacter sp. zg-Y238 TaxID=2964614 RepID=UPI0021059E89|nr:HNH endonuclease signature motif containing protein [Arthrobacter sp. zg-Y238]MCQ1953024.1 HNH endonuclease [Arthrobacter sp. zg-Y238]
MFEYSRPANHQRTGRLTADTALVNAWVEVLGDQAESLSSGEPEDRELIDRIRALEELKAAASAAQARAAAVFDASQRRKQAEAGVLREDLGRGVASQIALARRESPSRGGRLLGFAKVLTEEMPCTLHALTRGKISEWRATLLVRETACLSLEDRRRVDEEVAGDPEVLETLGDRQIISRARGAAYRLDPSAAVKRAAKAESERFVSCRPAPDTMTYLTGLLPVAQGVGVYAALSREADRLRASGDSRGRGQIMADTLVERVTGQTEAGQLEVEVQLVMTDRTLFGGDSEPAVVPGYGPVPAQWARDLVRGRHPRQDAEQDDSDRGAEPGQNHGQIPDRGQHRVAGRTTKRDKQDERWLRRLYADPDTGELVAMDSRARLFPTSLGRLIAARDQTCRMPWCGAPIRHFDHIRPHRDGGETSTANGQGLCEACNQAKEAPDWKARTVDTPGKSGPHTVETTTPTGHTYRSTAPPLPGVRAVARAGDRAGTETGIETEDQSSAGTRPVKRSGSPTTFLEGCIVDLIWAA